MKNSLILFPNQLFTREKLPEVHRVILVEQPGFFGMDQNSPKKLHKQKLILLRASMQRYVEEVLWPAGYEVDYVELDVFMNASDLLERAKHSDHVYLIDPVDEALTAALLQARRNRDSGPPVDFLPSPNFYLKEQEIREFFGKQPKSFTSFYQWQRERFDILIGENYKPEGGGWMLDRQKPRKISENQTLPSFPVFGSNTHVEKAIAWVNEHFPDNPGSTDFIWPTNHEEAAAWLENFVENRLDNYAAYRDTVNSQAPWLFHSALSSSLNIGLLDPQQVIKSALGRHADKPVPLDSLESFVRQVLGKREYARGLYVTQANSWKQTTTFKNQRRMTSAWRDGVTGLPPFDDLVRKLQAHGYAHQSERQMVAGSLMVLCEIHTDDVARWFEELFIDAFDWAMAPNLHGLYTFDDANNEVPIIPSNVLLQLSDYERGDWTDVWDGLYWRFIERHKETFGHNARLRPAVQRLERLDGDRKRIIGYRAEDFLNKFTQ